MMEEDGSFMGLLGSSLSQCSISFNSINECWFLLHSNNYYALQDIKMSKMCFLSSRSMPPKY